MPGRGLRQLQKRKDRARDPLHGRRYWIFGCKDEGVHWEGSENPQSGSGSQSSRLRSINTAMAARESIKVMLVTMFNPGRGDAGELERFRVGLALRPWKVAGFPRGMLWRNAAGVAALVAGVGPVNTAVNVLSLALRVPADWSKTYWLVAGVAGGNPSVCSLGSPVVANWVVDGDLAYDLHFADHPRSWSTGILPLGACRPYGLVKDPAGLFGVPAQIFQLNGQLAAWAHQVMGAVKLYDAADLSDMRRAYAAFRGGVRCRQKRPAAISCRPRGSGMARGTIDGQSAGCDTGPRAGAAWRRPPWKIRGPSEPCASCTG